MHKSTKQSPTRRWRSDVPDSVLLLRGRSFDGIPRARSLSPDAALIGEYIRETQNDFVGPAHAIVEAWAGRNSWADRIVVEVAA